MELAEQVEWDISKLVDKHRSAAPQSLSDKEGLQHWLSTDSPSSTLKKRRCVMTWDKLIKRIQHGYGMGHGADYQPWLTLRRKNSSRESNQVAAHLHPLHRPGYFFSRGEYQIALLLLWLGIHDLREQYPLWPIAHPHPLYGAPGTEGLQLGYCSGLLDIATEAGIEHGHFPGSDIPYVATIDFLVTIRDNSGFDLIAISCKPIEDPNQAVKWRTLERLELERRYAERNGIRYLIISSRFVPILMAGQLEWCMERATLTDAPHLAACVHGFSREFASAPNLSVSDAVALASESQQLSLEEGWTVFRHCAWTQAIDIDLSTPLLTSYPARRSGRTLREHLRRSLFEGSSK
ncbi:TnsA endonuclease N-terminal domain-containing protein [Oryzomicrobium sp.]|uniref:TnsA endonuclease N-terminal domain-containing protein n=1 Tax=Oryzomicrobium sp. TaxID=1911578 RepID=UPI0025D134BE|nr:TnsA endonuclease N-terminal domain-containing protein [Oryzomicrobium sp.]MCE1243668.1 TnsA endonuclease N-terminal domain-containing protein [Oryzomicrobium sp.]